MSLVLNLFVLGHQQCCFVPLYNLNMEHRCTLYIIIELINSTN
jgi:hypothetical protein